MCSTIIELNYCVQKQGFIFNFYILKLMKKHYFLTGTTHVHSIKNKTIINFHLNTIFPVACVRLITIKPLHSTKSMSPVFVPHPFICIARWIASSAESLSSVVDPISIIIWHASSVILQMSLKRYSILLASFLNWHPTVYLNDIKA